MITDTRDEIIEYINYHGQARVHDLARALQISNVAIHKQLKKLLEDKVIVRVGKPPLVFYKFPTEGKFETKETKQLPEYTKRIIQENFLSITPDGNLLYGLEGFSYWVDTYQKKGLFANLAQEYTKVVQEQKKFFSKEGLLDATIKIKNTFKETFIDHLLYQDIYSYKLFGRTKLAKLTMYAKQVGALDLIVKIAAWAKPIIEKIIKKYSINAISYIPPTVPRPLQFIDEFASQLNLLLSGIKLTKVTPGDIPIPQKTLATTQERVINARDSIYLKDLRGQAYKNVLLIDDVVGSGASFNETARKLKKAKIGTGTIIAFALVGSIKGYAVVREI